MKKRLFRRDAMIAVLATAGGWAHAGSSLEAQSAAVSVAVRSEFPEGGKPFAASLYDVVFSGGQFVAVGQQGTIRTSRDGREWQARDSDTLFHLRSVSAGEGVIVAVGDHGVITVSRDGGGVWKKVESGSGVRLSGVAYGRGLFVAVGSCGIILTSTDARRWGLEVSNTGSDLRCVTHGGKQWIVSGSARTLLDSGDGKCWTRVAMEERLPCCGRTAFLGDSFFMIVGRSRISRSVDARSWQTELEMKGTRLTAMTAGDKADVAVGKSGTILVSRRRGHWKVCPSPTRRDVYGVAFGNDQFVAVGCDGLILLSVDGGASWESVPAKP